MATFVDINLSDSYITSVSRPVRAESIPVKRPKPVPDRIKQLLGKDKKPVWRKRS